MFTGLIGGVRCAESFKIARRRTQDAVRFSQALTNVSRIFQMISHEDDHIDIFVDKVWHLSAGRQFEIHLRVQRSIVGDCWHD